MDREALHTDSCRDSGSRHLMLKEFCCIKLVLLWENPSSLHVQPRHPWATYVRARRISRVVIEPPLQPKHLCYLPLRMDYTLMLICACAVTLQPAQRRAAGVGVSAPNILLFISFGLCLYVTRVTVVWMCGPLGICSTRFNVHTYAFMGNGSSWCLCRSVYEHFYEH